MTIEELKVEAAKLGYVLVKKPQPKEKFLPCICGRNNHTTWYNYIGNSIKFVCNHCGRSASGKTDREARHNWNEMIKTIREDGYDSCNN